MSDFSSMVSRLNSAAQRQENIKRLEEEVEETEQRLQEFLQECETSIYNAHLLLLESSEELEKQRQISNTKSSSAKNRQSASYAKAGLVIKDAEGNIIKKYDERGRSIR